MAELPKNWTTLNLFEICRPTQWKTISTSQLKPEGYLVYGANGPIGFYEQFTHEKPTVMITCRGATCGNIHVSKPFSYINGNAMALDDLIEGCCHLRYLENFLKLRGFDDVISGSAQPQITRASLQKISLPLAPYTEQTRIVEKLEELLSDLDAGVAELKAAQKKLAQYRQSLLKAAVEGALTAGWRASRNTVRPEPFDFAQESLIEGYSTIHGSTVRQAHSSPRTVEYETGAQLLERILKERRARWEAKQLAKFHEQGKIPPKDWQDKYPEPVKPNTNGLPDLPNGWLYVSLDQLVSTSSYGTSVKCNYESGGIPVLRIPNVVERKLDLRDLKFAIQTLGLEQDEYLKVGDLLVVRTNGSIKLVGRAAEVLEQLPSNFYFASYLLRFRCVLSDIIPSWISAFLASNLGRKWIESRAASSAGQHNISLSTLLTIPIPFASLEEQTESLKILNNQLAETSEQERSVEVSVKQSAAQRKNVLKAAFSGQLAPQDPNDEPASVLLERIRAERAKRSFQKTEKRGARGKNKDV